MSIVVKINLRNFPKLNCLKVPRYLNIEWALKKETKWNSRKRTILKGWECHIHFDSKYFIQTSIKMMNMNTG